MIWCDASPKGEEARRLEWDEHQRGAAAAARLRALGIQGADLAALATVAADLLEQIAARVVDSGTPQ
jgi:hypothetical protein